MDIRHLRVFVAVYETSSLTAAAARINATQPGLSVRIAALELELNVKLFDRHARGLVPTFAGRRLYPRAVQILHDVDAATGMMKSLSGGIAGRFSVGVPPTVSKAILAPVLSGFLADHPDVEVRVVEAYSTTLIPLLESRDINCAIVTFLPDHQSIRLSPIYSDRFVLVSGPRLNLPAGGEVSVNADARLKLVIPSSRHGLHRLLEPALRAGQIVPARTVEIDGLSGALKLIEASDWAGLLPFAAVHDELGQSNLRVNAIAGNTIPIEYFLAQIGSEFLPPAAQIFVDLMAGALARIAPGPPFLGEAPSPLPASAETIS